MSKFKKVAKIALPAIGYYFGGPTGAALGGAAGGVASGGGLKGAAIGAGLGYAGGSIAQGAGLVGPPTAAQAANPLFGLGRTIGAIAPSLSSLGGIAQAIGAAGALTSSESPRSTTGPTPVQSDQPITKPEAMQRPASLGAFTGYDSTQERAALATRGSQRGLSGDEKTYYNNLVARSLIGDDNSIAGDTNSLLPVESQYFSGQGMNLNDVRSFLKAIMGAQ